MQKIVSSPRLYSALSSDAHRHSQVVFEVSPAHLARLFASSRCGSEGQLEWWSPLVGHAIPFAELTVIEQQQLLNQVAQDKIELAKLAQQLADTGQAAAAQIIYRVLRETDFSRLYSIAKQPVLVDWQTEPQEGVLPSPTIPSAADSAAMVMMANAAKSARAAVPAQRKSHWLWLLLIVAMLVLSLAAWW